MSKRHKAEAKLWAELRDEHGAKFRALPTGITTESDRYVNLVALSTMKSRPAVSFVVTMPEDSSMGKAFIEFYGKTKAKPTKRAARK